MATMEKGKLSVHTENILPVIKKWLYSEKEIFIRELVSNAHDAIEKVKKVALTEDIYQADDDAYAVDLKLDRENAILIIEDNGIGMTADEIREFIANIAFSGAEKFAEQYVKEGDTGIIGHFGLGFYSCFMVSQKVEIESRSFKQDARSVRWISDGSEEYEIGPGERQKRGTEIRLHLNAEEASEFTDLARVSGLIRRYLDFLPIPIRIDGAQVNRQKPLWTQQPASLKKEDYTEFYKYMFPHQGDPLFHIHLNVDHPFRLQGILYFPRLAHEMDLNKSNVKIYCQQVFVTDQAQELIPQFLTVLQGVIDLPELPLNVSRSYIQNEPVVRKIASHIIKKVADRLTQECKNNREEYEKIWSEIAPFVKYGMLSDESFYDQAKDCLLLEVLGSDESRKLKTIDEYLSESKDPEGKRVHYASDLQTQGQALRMLQKQGIEVVHLGTMIDSHFTGFLEMKRGDVKFVRVDAELHEHALDKDADSQILDDANKDIKSRLQEVFQKAVSNDKVTIRVEALKSDEVPAMILLPEQQRRMAEMSALWGEKENPFAGEHTLLVNTKNGLIQKLGRPGLVGADGSSAVDEKKEKVARQVYHLARLAQGAAGPAEMEKYAQEIFSLLQEMV
ncbi:MAG: molecular chaperone HtpG [Leptospiraceae bacterium]|nr:molecular chaperone HtpG [Leptospiraceae bacterium]